MSTSVYVPVAVRQEIEKRVRDNIDDYWYHYSAEQVAKWAYRRGVRDGSARRD